MKKILAILIPVVLIAGFSVYKIAANATTQPKAGLAWTKIWQNGLTNYNYFIIGNEFECSLPIFTIIICYAWVMGSF